MKTIYKLTRDLSGDSEMIGLSTDRKLLADLMRADHDKWTVPLSYTIEITLNFEGLYEEGRSSAFQDTDLAYFKTGRVNAFREAAEFFDREADLFRVGTTTHIGFRRASLKLFALMEQEIGK